MKQYLDLLRKIKDEGEYYPDRTGTGCYGIWGHQMRFHLPDGFPLLTTKRVHFKSVVHELLWFIGGSTNTKYLRDNGVTIWDEWADADGDLGPVYGKQWRAWETGRGDVIDQLSRTLDGIRRDPFGRRHIVTAWNPADLDKVALPWCHVMWQWKAHPDGELSLHLLQRSCDTFLGVPFNIASGALLLLMTAHVTGRVARDFVWTGTDVHLYANHMEQVDLQLSRKPRPLPRVFLDPWPKRIEEFLYQHVHLVDYDPHPNIPAPIAV